MERSLRGTSIGAQSLESEEGVVLASRRISKYVCPEQHVTELPFAEDADVPLTWECRECGETANLTTTDDPEEEKPIKPVRTHWDMLLERRSEEELQELLAQRLELLRRTGSLAD